MKSLNINKPIVSHQILGSLINLGAIIVSTIALYFVLLFSFCVPFGGYFSNNNIVNQYETANNLRLNYGETYQTYEKVVKEFYFEKYPEEIKDSYNNIYKKDFTITHIYNIKVLNLPLNPTTSNFSTTYYQYVANADGTFKVDELALRIVGSGTNYERNMSDLFYSSYNNLKTIGLTYEKPYGDAFKTNQLNENIIRTVSLAASIIVFEIILPLIMKNGSNVFDKIFKVGKVEYRNGYKLRTYKIILKAILRSILPCIGIYFATTYSIVLLIALPIFANFMTLILTKENRDIFDKLLGIDSCDLEQSLIFKNKEEETEYFKKEENKVIDDKEFLGKLTKVNDINVKKIESENK